MERYPAGEGTAFPIRSKDFKYMLIPRGIDGAYTTVSSLSDFTLVHYIENRRGEQVVASYISGVATNCTVEQGWMKDGKLVDAGTVSATEVAKITVLIPKNTFSAGRLMLEKTVIATDTDFEDGTYEAAQRVWTTFTYVD